MIELLQYPFMQRALIAGILVGLMASYFGVFVVQRGLSFLGHGLAHAAFGGVALGLLLGTQPLAVAIPFTVAMAIGIVWVEQRTELSSDTAVGIFFSLSMALGIVFLALKQGYSGDAFSLLFGSILAVSQFDLIVISIVAVACLAAAWQWGRWSYASFDRELARADGVAVPRDDYILAIALALVTVVATRVVGTLLIASFLVIPAATARLIAPTFARMTVYSMCAGVLSVVAGLFISNWVDMPSGATIILTQAALFFAIAALPFKPK